MASLDLDPLFARALRLMHSKSKDSEDQLRAMLDEAIKQRHGGNKTLANIFLKKVNSCKKVKSVYVVLKVRLNCIIRMAYVCVCVCV
jgi:hypothetical protein